MEKIKRIISLGCAVIMLLAVTACGNTAKDDNGTGTTKESVTTAVKTTAENVAEPELEPYTINILYPSLGTADDLDEVVAAVNEITKEKINATISITTVSMSNLSQQLSLQLASGEKLDLAYDGHPYGFQNHSRNGQLLALDDLLAEYGQNVLSVINMAEGIADCGKVDGVTYGVVGGRDWAATYGVEIRTDLLEKYNINPDEIKSYEDLTDVFAIIHENEPEMICVASTSGKVASEIVSGMSDTLLDNMGVIMNFEGTELVNLYETDEYREIITLVRDWYEKGYISKDYPTSQESYIDLMKSDRLFCYLGKFKPGSAEKDARQMGYEMTVINFTEPVGGTQGITNAMYVIPSSCENPERVMMFMDLLYSDSEILNTLAFGIEGKHYKVVSDNVIDYTDGVDSSNSTYNPGWGWAWGQQYLQYTWVDEPADLFEQTIEFNKSAKRSEAFGFLVDASEMKTESAALTNVTSQYLKSLENGAMDVDEGLDALNKALDEAGIDKYIEEKQRQLNEWLAK